jgi:lipopolysaccharide export system permease protein
LVDDARDPTVHATILAESGQLLEGRSGPRALLLNGSRQEIDRQTGRLNMLTFSENEIDLADAAGTDAARPADMSELGVWDLLNPKSTIAGDVPKWIAEGHKRLAGPLTGDAYALIALVSVLMGAFRRHGGFIRPLTSVIAVVLLLALGFAIGSLAARDNAFLSLMWVHAVAPSVVCAVALFVPLSTRGPGSGRIPTQTGDTIGTSAA